MIRFALAAALTLVLGIGTASAKEYKGTLTKIDAGKNTLTVKVGDDEKTFTFADTTEFLTGKKAKAIPKTELSKLADSLGDKGRPVILVTEEKDDKEVLKGGKPVAAKVTLSGGKKKDKDK